jgi:Tol biopolymer transport system component
MRSQGLPSPGGALAAAVLLVAACGGAVTPTTGPIATGSATSPAATPGAVATVAPTAAPTAAPTPAPTLAATVQGVANGRIAYGVRSIDGSSNIFSVMPDGTGQLQLTTGAGNHLCAAYSADGSQLAYCADGSGQFEIWTMQADGTKQTQVTHLKGRALFPDFSPNGKKIAFAGAIGADPHTEVYVVDAATGENLVALTSCNGKADGCANDYPAWSPDGKHIVYVHGDDFTADEKPVNEQVWLMDADGGNKHALTTGSDPKDQVPSWSPDGTFIVYASGVGDNEGIWVMAADGSAPVQLTGCPPAAAPPCAAGSDIGPVWSPDGTRIAFLRGFTAVGSNDRPVYVMNADGTDQRRLIEGKHLAAVPAWQALPE